MSSYHGSAVHTECAAHPCHLLGVAERRSCVIPSPAKPEPARLRTPRILFNVVHRHTLPPTSPASHVTACRRPVSRAIPRLPSTTSYGSYQAASPLLSQSKTPSLCLCHRRIPAVSLPLGHHALLVLIPLCDDIQPGSPHLEPASTSPRFLNLCLLNCFIWPHCCIVTAGPPRDTASLSSLRSILPACIYNSRPATPNLLRTGRNSPRR